MDLSAEVGATRPLLPIHRLDSGSAFVVEGRPLVCRGEDIEALPPYRLSVKQGRIESAERAMPLPGQRADVETFLMPGLADPHVHLVGMASARLHAVESVAGVGSLDDFLGRVADLAATRTADWVRLEGFEEAELAEGEIPSLAALDRVCPDRPLRVRHASRHGSLHPPHAPSCPLRPCTRRRQRSPGSLICRTTCGPRSLMGNV